MGPVIILFSERSGSNLLRSILNAHPAIAAPPPPHLWVVLDKALKNARPSTERIVEMALYMTQLDGTPYLWKHKITKDEVLPMLGNDAGMSEIIGAIYQKYAEKEGKSCWATKEVETIRFTRDIIDTFPDARFIYLHRDGRDAALSQMKRSDRWQHIYLIARRWNREQQNCLSFLNNPDNRGRICRIAYESLIIRPRETLEKACEAIGIPFDPAMLNYHDTSDAKGQADAMPFWENIGKPLMKDNSGKYKKELTPKQIRIFESIAGSSLKALGYTLDYADAPFSIGPFRDFSYRAHNKIKRYLRKEKMMDSTRRYYLARKHVEQVLRKTEQ